MILFQILLLLLLGPSVLGAGMVVANWFGNVLEDHADRTIVEKVHGAGLIEANNPGSTDESVRLAMQKVLNRK